MTIVCRRVLLLLSLLHVSALAAPDWTAHHAPDQPLQLWVKPHGPDQPYELVRAEITINAPILPLLGLLQDADRQQQWLPYTQDVTIVGSPGANQTLVHFRTVTRWPFRPRDAVTRFDVSATSPSQLHIDMINQPQALPAEAGFLRIQQAQGYWLLNALPDCRTRVRYESGSRWGGMIPQWLVDRTNRDLAREALHNLKQLAEAHYQEYEPNDETDTHITAHRHCR